MLNRIATTLRIEVDDDPNPEGPIQLTFAEFERAVVMLMSVGFDTERSAEEAWADFRGWRVNYESVAYRLADRFTAPPAPRSGQRHHMRSGPVEPFGARLSAAPAAANRSSTTARPLSSDPGATSSAAVAPPP